ncbi:MAG: EpsG family protein [Vulcanibacillus sp.]
MYSFIFIFILLSFFGLLLNIRSQSSRYIYIFFIFLFLMAYAVIREIDFTSDTLAYSRNFIKYGTMSWNNLLQNSINITIKDPLFWIFTKLIYSLGFSVKAWFFIISAIFSVLFSATIVKYSKDIALSFILLIALDYYYFSLTGLRQAIALAIIFYSWRYIESNQNIKFIVFVLIASMFHISALIALIILFLKNKKFKIQKLVLIPIIIIVMYFITPLIVVVLNQFLPTNYQFYINSRITLNLSGFFIQLVILIFAYLFSSDILKKDKSNNILFNILYIGLFLQLLATFLFAEFFRISYYFSVFALILVPNVIATSKSNRLVLKYAVAITLILYFLLSTSDFLLLY